MEKVLFSSFLNVFQCFRPCECMRKHALTGRNTQQIDLRSDETFVQYVSDCQMVLILNGVLLPD